MEISELKKAVHKDLTVVKEKELLETHEQMTEAVVEMNNNEE